MTRLACGLVAGVWWVLAAGQASAQVALVATAPQIVMPFENPSRDPRMYWLAEGSAILLTDDLLALGAQALTRDERVSAFDRLHVPPVATLSYATVIRLGQVVGATRVILGSFTQAGEDLTVRVRVLRLDTGRLFPEIVESGPLTDLFAIYGRVARRLVPDVRVTAERMEDGRPPPAAFEQYVKGELAEGPSARVAFLLQAIRLSPAFHRARLALWAVHTDQGEHQQALDAVKPVPADHALARRARFLGAVSLINLGQFEGAHDALFELNRVRPDASLLNDLGVTQLRRPAGAPGGTAATYFADAARADPADPDLFFNLGYASWIERDVPEAIQALREAVRRNPSDGEAHYVLGAALQASGAATEAAREKDLAHRVSSVFAEWEAKQPGANSVPRGLERMKADLGGAGTRRVKDGLVAAGQRDQRELATFQLESGRRLFQAGRDVDAITELKRAVYLAPYEAEAHLLLGRAYLRTGRVKEAVDALKISIWSDDTLVAHLALADAYLRQKDVTAARREAQLALTRDPGNTEARRLLDRMPPP